MSKLHELLAVETNLETQANKAGADLTATFQSKKHLFGQKLVTFTPSEPGAQTVTEEQSDIQSTVADEIDWITKILAKALDVSHQVDVANTLAKADVVTEDGDEILKDIPATSLLQLEKRLQSLREFCGAIPTLDPAKGFKAEIGRAHV